MADRVNLGLLPSSEECWPVACAALKATTGGWLHIHGNVATKQTQHAENQHLQDPEFDTDKYSCLLTSQSLMCSGVGKWISYVRTRILCLLREVNPPPCVGLVGGGDWQVDIQHVEHVKQYAPHQSHLVLDLKCTPSSQSV